MELKALPRDLVFMGMDETKAVFKIDDYLVTVTQFGDKQYAYSLEHESLTPEHSFYSFRDGFFSPQEHQELSEMVVELLNQ